MGLRYSRSGRPFVPDFGLHPGVRSAFPRRSQGLLRWPWQPSLQAESRLEVYCNYAALRNCSINGASARMVHGRELVSEETLAMLEKNIPRT